jgi:hypothetical protein
MALLWDGCPHLLDQLGSVARATSALALLGACCTLAGCALDTRTLEAANASGSSGAGGTSSSGSGSASKPPPPIDLPICEYPGGASIQPGCDTIAENAGFTQDITGWDPEAYSIKIDWEAGDAKAAPDSGSIAVTNTMFGTSDGLAPGAGTQCIPATPGATYDMAGDVFIPEGQGDGMAGGGPYVGEAGLSILFWANPDCSDVEPTHGSFQSDLVLTTGAWIHVEGGAVAPDVAKAMSLRVLTIKPFKQFKFKALFDNVLLRER